MTGRIPAWFWAVLLVPAAVVGYWLLDRGYGKTSETGYRYAVALFSACNQQDAGRLRKISQLVDVAREAGQVQRAEARWLAAIIAQGLDGDWEKASRNVRRLLEDQLERAPPLPGE